MENFLSRYRNVSILVAVLFAQVLGLAVQVKRSTENASTQVIGSSGSEQSRSIYIDKGSNQGLDKDMPVITADGVIGRVLKVYPSVSQVLLINDQTSGVGAILEQSRLQGILRGTPAGEVILEKVMSDETVQPGEKVLTSGGDQIFPKGLPLGIVSKVSAGPEMFLNICGRPGTHLSKLGEMPVITRKEERPAAVAETAPARAVDILSQRLPSVPDKPRENAVTAAGKTTGTPNPAAATSGATQGPAASVPAPKTPPAAKNATTSKPSRAQVATDAVPAPNVQPLAKGAKKPGVDASSTSTSTTVKPAIAQKPTPPAVKVSQQTTKPIDAPPKPEQQPAVTPAPPEDKPQ